MTITGARARRPIRQRKRHPFTLSDPGHDSRIGRHGAPCSGGGSPSKNASNDSAVARIAVHAPERRDGRQPSGTTVRDAGCPTPCPCRWSSTRPVVGEGPAPAPAQRVPDRRGGLEPRDVAGGVARGGRPTTSDSAGTLMFIVRRFRSTARLSPSAPSTSACACWSWLPPTTAAGPYSASPGRERAYRFSIRAILGQRALALSSLQTAKRR
jgi:hypothetical protein